MKPEGWHATLASFEKGLAESDTPFFRGLAHGSMELELYRPVGADLQTPHTRDELYIVRQGNGTFERDGERIPFGPGDALFVPAQTEHRFVEFSDDFDTWVIFWGPEGGEQDAD